MGNKASAVPASYATGYITPIPFFFFLVFFDRTVVKVLKRHFMKNYTVIVYEFSCFKILFNFE